jgi:transformation/transcription domain-associated protein
MFLINQIQTLTTTRNREKDNPKHLQDVVNLLVSHLSAPNPRVRKNTHQALETLAEITSMKVSDLLSKKAVEHLLLKLSAQPLNELPRVVQIGYLDAITYFISLRPALVTLDDGLVGLVKSVLQLAKEEEPTSQRQSKVSHIVKQRVGIIEFFSAIVSLPEFHEREQFTEICNEVIAYFFQSLTLRSEAVILVAKKGLNLIVDQRPLDKGLLKSSLRPIVSNISDHRKLTVPLLEGLERLLHLIRHAFNQNLADKLLSHLKVLSDPENANLYSGKSHKHDKAVRIPMAILELFHLLPHSSPMEFLEQLVPAVLKLEHNISQGHFPKILDSPYRPPLIKFMNRYPTESVDYFLTRLREPAYRQLFWVVVQSKSATAIHNELSANVEKLIANTFRVSLSVEGSSPIKAELQFQGILIVRNLLRHIPDLLDRNADLLACLEEIWSSPDRLTRLQHEASLPLMQLRESKLLVKCFITRIKGKPEDNSCIKLMFDMLSILIFPTTMDFTFLRDFYKGYIPATFTVAQKLTLFNAFVDFLNTSVANRQYELATAAIKFLIVPLLEYGYETPARKQEHSPLITAAFSAIIGTTASAPGFIGTDEAFASIKDSALNIELLHVVRVIISYRLELNDFQKKTLLKFAFHHYKGTEVTTQQSAALFLATASAVCGLPTKITPQIYAHLLKAHQQEAKGLVREALDKLLPVMAAQKNDLPMPIWIQLIRKILLEEAFAVPQLVHIIQLMVRNERFFFPFHQYFITTMLGALPRLGLLPNSNSDTRNLALRVVKLILKWELRRREESASSNPTPEQSPRKSSTRSQNRRQEETPQPEAQTQRLPRVESILPFLLRILVSEYKPGEVISFCNLTSFLQPPSKTERLFIQTLEVWPELDPKIELLEKLQPRPQPQGDRPNTRWIFVILKLLIVSLEKCQASWVSVNTAKIVKLLDITLTRKEDEVSHNLRELEFNDEQVLRSSMCMDLLAAVVKAYPNDYTGEIYPKIKQCISDIFHLEPVCFYISIPPFPLPSVTYLLTIIVAQAPDYLSILSYY